MDNLKLSLKTANWIFSIFFLTAIAQTNISSATENEEDLTTKNLLFTQKNAEDEIQIDLKLSDNIVTIGESFFATITVSYNKEMKVRLPGPFFNWEPFYKNSHKITPLAIKNGIATYTIVYELSTFDLEPKFFKDISIEYWKKNQTPENPPNVITIKGPSIAIKRIITKENLPNSTIGDMRSAFIIHKHLTAKEYLQLAAAIIFFLAIFALIFLWIIKSKRKKTDLLLVKKELSAWEKKITAQNSPSREDLRIFYQKISSIAKKILSLVSSNATIPSMTAKEITAASKIDGVHQNTKKNFLDFLKKSEEIKYSIDAINTSQALQEIKKFTTFLQTIIYHHRKNLRKRKNHALV